MRARVNNFDPGSFSKRGAVVIYNGESWVATRDTNEMPPGQNWQPAILDDPSLIPEKGDKGDKGDSIKGDKGDKGDPGIGPPPIKGDPGEPGIVWKGLWNRRVTYHAGEAVSWGGSSYVCTADETQREPSADSRHWNILAARGEAGSAGKRETTIIHRGSPRVVQALDELERIREQLENLPSGGAVTPIAAIFDSSAIKGMAVYVPSDNHADLANNNSEDQTAVGICFADVLAGAAGQFLTEGEIERDDWTAVTTEATTDLVPNEIYYLGLSGQITVSPPSTTGLWVQAIGTAVNSRTLSIEVSNQSVLL